jgi:hypothetical protein
MTSTQQLNFSAIRDAMKMFDLSPKVEPNEPIEAERAFFPDGHRGILDLKRQLVVGNRGMGKSFWTHALTNKDLRSKLSINYGIPLLAKTEVQIGFNGSEKLNSVAPTTDEIALAVAKGFEPDLIWRAALFRAAKAVESNQETLMFKDALEIITNDPQSYSELLTRVDDLLTGQGKNLLVVFDALDRLAQDWPGIGKLTKALLVRTVGLQSFRSIRAKIFMRLDQFADESLFSFPDSSKIRNDYVRLSWSAYELYGLLLFELMRQQSSNEEIRGLAEHSRAITALPTNGRLNTSALSEQAVLIAAIAGEFMGNHKKRGRVYTWVPLHLSDAANTCSPRTFLTAWKTAAEHVPSPIDKVVDHQGLIDGVRKASTTRLQELREDYPWIDPTLQALKRQLVPISREDLFGLWRDHRVLETILNKAKAEPKHSPIGLYESDQFKTLLGVMTNISVMEERANGKINVPDIFRVEAEILRKGGVAVPKRS